MAKKCYLAIDNSYDYDMNLKLKVKAVSKDLSSSEQNNSALRVADVRQ